MSVLKNHPNYQGWGFWADRIVGCAYVWYIIVLLGGVEHCGRGSRGIRQDAEGMRLRRICDWLIPLLYRFGRDTWHSMGFSFFSLFH